MERKVVSEAIDCETFKRALLAAQRLLREHEEEINRLNVFPVPDGDTGTNMLLTVNAVVEGLDSVGAPMSRIAERVSRRAIIGARGNSGVILAQFLVGFAAAVGNKEAIDVDTLTEGFTRGTEEAYRIVSHPKEGTILTIMRSARDAIVRLHDSPLETILISAFGEASTTLAQTPEMLPILKSAGVVDAGGLGFVYLLSALVAVLDDEEPHPSTVHDDQVSHQSRVQVATIQKEMPAAHRYCTEFNVAGKGISHAELRERLARHADSVLVLEDDDLSHVHLHTDDPGEALRVAAMYGRVFQVKVDDMYEQVRGFLKNEDRAKEARQETAVVAISPGAGITEILRSVGASEVFTGSPAVGDILEGISRIGAEGILLLPNDPNILLACKQVAQLTKRPTAIVCSKSVPQGISALLAYDLRQGLEENVEAMQKTMAYVRSGSIGRATRHSTINGVRVDSGDYVGILEQKIVVAGRSVDDVMFDLLDLMGVDSAEVISLFYGLDVGERGASAASARIKDRYPGLDVQLYYGGQAHYDYLVSVEGGKIE